MTEPSHRSAAADRALNNSPPALSDQTRARLNQRLRQGQRDGRLPSLVAGVFAAGVPLWTGACGSIDGRPGGVDASPEFGYRIGSITKTFVAVSVLRLAAAGAIELDDSIRDRLPELPGEFGPVTTTSLLTHTSGLPAEIAGQWWERVPGMSWAQLAPTLRRLTPVGQKFHYSNAGFAVLGELIHRVSGQTWWKVVQTELLGPLGMTSTRYLPDDRCVPGWAVHPFLDLIQAEPAEDAAAAAPAGQLWSTVADLARWGSFLADGDEKILPSEWHERMVTPVAIHDAPDQPWVGAHGLGVEVFNHDGDRRIGHGGSMPGFLAGLAVRPNGLGVTVLANATTGLERRLAADLLEIATDGWLPEIAPWQADQSQREVIELAGLWYWGTTPVLFRAWAQGCELVPVGVGRGARFRATGPGEWLGLDGYYAGELLRVLSGGAGQPVLDCGTFRFTRTPYDPDGDTPGRLDQQGWH
ncbi:serine hydrolase domain-containing protein [Tsukamurella sp. USMM236]|uniref:serine hydrolase domain-containing protein n=1 Tax=Tsukamurella sp. USMM236 TaxID=3081301 RepID=UPI00301ABD59